MRRSPGLAQVPCNAKIANLNMPFWTRMNNQYILRIMLALSHTIRTSPLSV